MNEITRFPIEFKEVTPHTILVNFKDYFNLNAGAIILNNFIIVIDTLMYPVQAKGFRERLEMKFSLPVKYLFITHYHADHLFGVAAFKDIEIFGSSLLIENMKKRKEENWTTEAFNEWKKEEPTIAEMIDEIEIIIPTNGFKTKRVIEDDGLNVKFYHSGGHTGCSSFAYFPEEKVLFSGDLIAAGYWPFISDPTEDFEGWISSFEYMLNLDIEIVIPGHGPLVEKGYIKEQLIFMKNLKNNVLKAISEGKKLEQIEIPEYKYKPAEDWQIPRALEYLFNFYSNDSIY
jgi:glyoxylase-like metal-dependent hydrolase (beta-lactamase superfamily II)